MSAGVVFAAMGWPPGLGVAMAAVPRKVDDLAERLASAATSTQDARHAEALHTAADLVGQAWALLMSARAALGLPVEEGDPGGRDRASVVGTCRDERPRLLVRSPAPALLALREDADPDLTLDGRPPH